MLTIKKLGANSREYYLPLLRYYTGCGRPGRPDSRDDDEPDDNKPGEGTENDEASDRDAPSISGQPAGV